MISRTNQNAILRATAATAVARLSHHNCLSVRPSVTQVDQSKTVQARSPNLHRRMPRRL